MDVNADNMTMTYSGLVGKERKVYVRFERPEQTGTSFAESCLPEGKIEKSFGFTQQEIAGLELYLHQMGPEIMEKARKVGQDLFWKKI